MTPTLAIRQSVAGFTLLELIIVLAILAMGSVLLIPNIGNMSSRTFTAQAREVAQLRASHGGRHWPTGERPIFSRP